METVKSEKPESFCFKCQKYVDAVKCHADDNLGAEGILRKSWIICSECKEELAYSEALVSSDGRLKEMYIKVRCACCGEVVEDGKPYQIWRKFRLKRP